MAESTTANTPETGQPELKRAIGPKLLFFFVIGDILGTGIYTLTGDVAGKIGGALWMPFLGAFLVAFLTAFSYLELVGKYPRAAGAALYTNRAWGIHFLTFIVAFMVMCSGITSASTAAHGFGGTYLPRAFDIQVSGTVIAIVAVIFVLVLAAINFRGVSESVKANVVLTCIELSGLLIIIVVGIWAVLQGDGEPSRLVDVNPPGDQHWTFAIAGATGLAFFAMVGFEDSVNMAEECKEPAKIFPKSLLWGLAGAGLIYILVSVTASLLVPADQLAKAKSNSLFLVLEAGAPGFPLKVFAFIGLLAVVNSALINMLMASRLLYGMANERVLPPFFSTVHPLRRTPWVSILFTTGIAALLVGLVSKDAVSKLGGTTALLLLVVFFVVNIAVLRLRREKVEHKHFRAPTWAPILGAILCACLALPGVSGKKGEDYLIAGILVAGGIVLWGLNWLYMRARHEEPHHLDPENLTK
ncbi:amino acid/polyamine/organocation transporter (APC superfamily) [Herbihabitans rhizosphaerae]|uniref:Amino acid/polyamine/organocation transporter (APC superfamily) n=1 Tax=Herbihabitans rhizosphaerae TaxID=1872711 RepID=A0A4Q7KWL2_9PSEU|nr:APC family permease [Herbihabitans rhizosphaerae]RZS40976.1 amino acid/polyamine/organocation transporter (APC superfamily) [Herbihabitans rhizosphaerae]